MFKKHKENLYNKIKEIKLLLDSASQCLKHDDLLQCAVRLQDITESILFTADQFDLYELLSMLELEKKEILS